MSKPNKMELSNKLNALLVTDGIDFTPMKVDDMVRAINILMDLQALVTRRSKRAVKDAVIDMIKESKTAQKIAKIILEE